EGVAKRGAAPKQTPSVFRNGSMLPSGALASIMPAYGALPPSSQQDRSKRIGFEVGRYANVMASKGFGSKLSFGPDELPELRLPIVTWDQPPTLITGGG